MFVHWRTQIADHLRRHNMILVYETVPSNLRHPKLRKTRQSIIRGWILKSVNGVKRAQQAHERAEPIAAVYQARFVLQRQNVFHR